MAKILDPKPGPDPKGPPETPIDPPPAKSEVGKLYAKLGGARWGTPGDTFTKMRGRRGEYQHFLPPQALSAPMTICWTPESGAHVLGGDIRWAWYSGGLDKSVVGCPTSEEMVTHDGVGRFQTFEHGVYVWHPETGTHEVHGAIQTLYAKLGGSAFGYPTTDESGTPDGRGRFNHFRDVAGRTDKSIYWTAQTGAHEVYGYIRKAWVNNGAERGPLGYPTTGEMNTHDNAGRFQTFEHGICVWHPQIGAHIVFGNINARYLQAGGTKFGYPINDVTITPDKRGTYLHLREMSGGGDRSVYWTPQTGAQTVYGQIREAWARGGWERSALGYPTSDEADTHDHHGRFQMFENGLYVWHPEFGARGVFGAISSRYLQIGGTVFGYPIGEQLGANGGGQFMDFRNLDNGNKRSIYWSPSTGAVEVYGLIRERWSTLGKEKGYLGYPTKPEQDWTESHEAGARVQQFQHGRILYTGKNGAAADPMHWLHELPKAGIEGYVEATLHYEGSIDFHAYIKDSSWQAYNYIIQALLKGDNKMAVAFSRKSSVSSTIAGDDRNHHRETVSNNRIKDNYWAFARGSLEVNEEHWGKVTGFIGDAVEGLLKFAIGTVVFADPTTTLLIIAGVEAASEIVGSGFVGGLRVVGSTLFLAGPNGTLFALAAEAIAALATKERGLNDFEWTIADAVFKGTVPHDRVRVSDAKGGKDAIFTFPRADDKMVLNVGHHYDDLLSIEAVDTLYLPGSTAGTYVPRAPGQTLVHELVHAWQYINNDAAISYVGDAIWSKIRHVVHPGADPGGPPNPKLPPEYDPGVEFKESWESFGLEQQAVIVSQWFASRYTGGTRPDPKATTSDFGLSSPGAINDDRFRYIRDHIRTGNN